MAIGLLLLPGLAAAQEDALALEKRLDQAEGSEELVLRLELCAAYWELEDREAVRRHAERAVDLARQVGTDRQLADALDWLADAQRYLSDYPVALAATLEALAIYERLGDRAKVADVLDNAGVTLRRMGSLLEAVEQYLRALETFEELGDRPGMARVLNNIGVVYRRLDDKAKALEVYQRALAIQEEEGNEAAVARLLNNIGILHRIGHRHQEAIDHYRRSIAIKKRLGDELGVAYTLRNLGNVYEIMGDLDLAMETYQDALEIRERYPERNALPGLLTEIGRIERRRGDLETALAYVERALGLAREILARESERDALEEMSEIYAATGRYQEALEAFKGYERIAGDILDAQRTQVVAELEMRYASEQKEKEIELLERQGEIAALELERQQLLSRSLAVGLGLAFLIFVLLLSGLRMRLRAQAAHARQLEREDHIRELEAKQAEIEATNKEMEHFTYTVSHDLRSPLFTIRGFLGMLERDVAERDAERVESDMGHIRNAVDKMGHLIDELLELSRIGRVANPSREVALTELARDAAGLLEGLCTERGVHLEIAPDLPSVVGDRPRLLEVLQNLIENAVKYMGDQADPKVEVGRRRDGSEEVVFVRDNGSGIEPAYHDKVFGLFQRLETSQKGTGIGLALVKRIVEVHGGRIWVESEGAGGGSAFCFVLPWANESPAMHRGD